MTTPPQPKRDPPIVAEEIGDGFDLVDETEIEDITGHDLSPEDLQAIEELERGHVAQTISLVRSIPPSHPLIDPDVENDVDQLFAHRLLAPQAVPTLPSTELPEEKTQPHVTTPRPPPLVAEEEDEDDAFYAQFEQRKG